MINKQVNLLVLSVIHPSFFLVPSYSISIKMFFKISLFTTLCLNVLLAAGEGDSNVVRHGLIGYGISMYKPVCAFSCRAVVSGATLSCSTEEMGGMSMSGMSMGMAAETSAECYSTDDSYLQTVAWCMSTRCKDVPVSDLEQYWEINVVGDQKVQPKPKESYQQALASVKGAPTEAMVSGNPLNKTSLVGDDDYDSNLNALSAFESFEDSHERYG